MKKEIRFLIVLLVLGTFAVLVKFSQVETWNLAITRNDIAVTLVIVTLGSGIVSSDYVFKN